MPFQPVLNRFVPVPAVFAPSQQRGHEIAVYIFPHDHSLCYEFFFHCRSADHVTQTYLCCGCKALRTRDNQKYRQPIPSCKLRHGCFVTDPMNPIRSHFCMPRSTPQATTRRLIIERCNELRAGTCEKSTKNVVEEILSDITSPKFDDFPMTERRVMVEQIASPYGNARENLRRTLQRNQQRGLNAFSSRPRLTGKTRKQRVKSECHSDRDPPYSKAQVPHSNSAVPGVPKKRFVFLEPIRTLVFMDLAATHVFPGFKDALRRVTQHVLNKPSLCMDTLSRMIMETQPGEYPRITEMSLLSIPRDIFTRGQKTIHSLVQEAPYQSFVLRLSTNVLTCQMNPELDDQQWESCQGTSESDVSVVLRPRCDLELKRTFAEEWPLIRNFLDECPKPVCLVAHNGIFFDYRVLYGELFRCGFIEKGMGVPKGVVFIDSALAIREIEEGFFKEVYGATKELASHRALHGVAHYGDIATDFTTDVERNAIASRVVLNESVNFMRTSSTTASHRLSSEGFSFSNVARIDGRMLNGTHPLSLFNVEDWPPAKLRRIRPEFFMRNRTGDWEFNHAVAKDSLKDDLPALYETVVKTPYGAHFTQEDAEALLQICVAYGKEFQDYVDHKAAHFPF